MIPGLIFFCFCILILIGLSVISIINTLSIPRLTNVKSLAKYPFVSILIPARNEEKIIQNTIKMFQLLDYPEYEVIILDDCSTDKTYEVALSASKYDPKIQVHSGLPLPPDWLGKNWACHQLSNIAKGELFIFTDADTIWKPDTLKAIIHLMQIHQADMMSVFPTQLTVTFTERMVIPLLTFSILAYLPDLLVRYTHHPAFAAANGQCLVFKKYAYMKINGHFAVRNMVLEDMNLAWNLKRKGLKLVIALGNQILRARMYENWQQVRNGFTKNILAGYGNSIFLLILSTIFHWSLFLAPWVGFLICLLLPESSYWLTFFLAILTIGILIRLLTNATAKQNIFDGIGMPISVILMTIIAFEAIYLKAINKPSVWKGRAVYSLNRKNRQ